MTYSNADSYIVKDRIKRFLQEDLGYGDITSKLVPNKKVEAKIIAKSDGILCGLFEATLVFEELGITTSEAIQDGNYVKKGDQIIKLKGNLRDILAAERTALNILMRMSAVATSTNDFVKKLTDMNLITRIAASRKTTPGFRIFEKRAVLMTGGDSHRWRMDDMVLLKDTHLDASNHNIEDLIKVAKNKTSFSKKIEIEVESESDAIKAARSGADIIMIDNQTPSETKRIMDLIKEISEQENFVYPLFEASGNITHKNFIEYAKAGVDVISSSEITMNPHLRLDLSLKICID